MPRALITGAAGFIGSHLTEACLSRGWHVVAVESLTTYYSPAAKVRNAASFDRHHRCTYLEQDILDPPGDLVVTALLRGQIRHGRHPRNHVDAGDRRRVSRVRESGLCHADITHGRNLQGQPKHRPTDNPANHPGHSTSVMRQKFRC